MRIGINTGEVLVGILAGSDYTAMGDVVNTASRLQALAPPGGVLAGAATHRPVPAVDPPRAASASPASAAASRTSSRGWSPAPTPAGIRPVRCDVPFIGRHHERTLLDAAVQLVRNGHSGVVSIIGEAGAGKSRLADEIIGPLEGEAIVLRTACAPYGDGNVWAPVVSGIAALFGVDTDASPEEVARHGRGHGPRSCGTSTPADPALRRYLDVVGFLLGHDSPLDRLDAAGARDAVLVTLTEMVRRHAETRMTVLFVDNLQWADPIAARPPRRHRALARPTCRSCSSPPSVPTATSSGRRPSSGRSCCRCRSVRWTSRRRRRWSAGIFDNAGAEPTERTVATLVDRGGGNPLFLVELAGAGGDLRRTSCPARCGR